MDEPNPRLAELLAPWIELFDQVFADEPVHSRPLSVAMMLVSEGAVTGSGPDERHYLEQDWFGAIVQTTTNWYSARYGRQLLEVPQSTVRAAILIYGSIFQVLVPTNPTTPGPRAGTVTLHFTSTLLADEEPEGWILNPPVLRDMDERQATKLHSDLIAVCNRTRSIINGVAGADLGKERVQPMAAAITTHIDNAVLGFCEGRSAGKQLAIWELHLAVEKALKVFLLRQGVTPPNIHDLKELERLAGKSGLLPLANDLLGSMPSSRDAVRYRYGELPAPPVATFHDWYLTALKVIEHVVNALPRGFFAKHASVTIQALPWHPSRSKAR